MLTLLGGMRSILHLFPLLMSWDWASTRSQSLLRHSSPYYHYRVRIRDIILSLWTFYPHFGRMFYVNMHSIVIRVTYHVILYSQSFLIFSCSIQHVLSMLWLESCFGQKLFSKPAWFLATFFTYFCCHSIYRTQICQSSTQFIHVILSN